MNSQTIRSSRSPLIVLGMVFLLLGFLSLLFIPVPSKTFFWKAVYNFGHVPLFGLVAVLLLWVSRALIKRPSWPSIQHYGIALLGGLVLALLTEAIQSLDTARQPTVSDVLHDLLGAMCGLILFFTYETHATGPCVQWRQFPRNIFLRLSVVLILCITLFPVFEWGYRYWERANHFPSLLEFSFDWEMQFVKASDSALRVVLPPVGWKKLSGDLVGRVEFHRKKYPGFILEEPYPDWQGYTHFQFDIFSTLSTLQSITILVDDVHHNQEYADRFNRLITISPGLNHIQISLDDIRLAPEGRELDLAAIRRVLWFANSPSEKFTLYFDNIRLVCKRPTPPSINSFSSM